MEIRLNASPQTRKDIDELIEFLDRLHNPPRAMVHRVADVVRSEFNRNFQQQASGRGAWAPLAESTVLDRIRQGYSGRRPILVRSGSYRQSFVNAGDSDHVEDLDTRPNGWTLSVGSQDKRVPWHERGTRRMPARSVVTLTRHGERRVRSAVDELFDRLAP